MTNAWASSPSPSLDTLSSESSSSSVFLLGWHILWTVPRRLWHAYVAYLWYYQPSSWVGRVASTFRVLAVALILPVVLLTLLDVTSYVIARTLGVVDDVKASTSDADTAADEQHSGAAVAVPVSVRLPTTFVPEGPVRDSEGLAPEDSVEGRTGGNGHGHEDGDGRVSETVVRAMSATSHAPAQAQTWDRDQLEMRPRTTGEKHILGSDASSQAYYFAGEENLRLAGEGVFSPAVSMPPSPLTPRMPLHTFTEGDGRGSGRASEEEGVVLRRRVQGAREDESVHT